jgi:hypothetical protein
MGQFDLAFLTRDEWNAILKYQPFMDLWGGDAGYPSRFMDIETTRLPFRRPHSKHLHELYIYQTHGRRENDLLFLVFRKDGKFRWATRLPRKSRDVGKALKRHRAFKDEYRRAFFKKQLDTAEAKAIAEMFMTLVEAQQSSTGSVAQRRLGK